MRGHHPQRPLVHSFGVVLIAAFGLAAAGVLGGPWDQAAAALALMAFKPGA